MILASTDGAKIDGDSGKNRRLFDLGSTLATMGSLQSRICCTVPITTYGVKFSLYGVTTRLSRCVRSRF